MASGILRPFQCQRVMLKRNAPTTQVDYPDYGAAAAKAVLDESGTYGRPVNTIILSNPC